MQRLVIEQNIHHFEALLRVEQDKARRAMLEKLLAEEQEKLHCAVTDSPPAPPAEEPRGAGPP